MKKELGINNILKIMFLLLVIIFLIPVAFAPLNSEITSNKYELKVTFEHPFLVNGF